MHEDDHLFIRCLMVVLLVAAGVLSMLLLAPPPESAWDSGVASGTQPLDRSRLVTRDILINFRHSTGPRAFPAPIQTGESAPALTEILTAPTPVVRMARVETRPRPMDGPLVRAGPLAELSLDTRDARTSPAAEESLHRRRGGEGSLGGAVPPPPPPPVEVPPPQRLELAAENIVAIRPVFPRAPSRPLISDLSAQDTDEDPLPEFRLFRPRFKACARDVSRRADLPVRGKVVLRFTVDERGSVRNARAVGGSLRDPDACDCLINALSTEPLFAPRPEAVTAERAVIFAG